MGEKKEEVRWEISVPIFKNRIILKQLGLAIGIPFGLVLVIIWLASGFNIYTLYAFGLIIALFILTWLLLIVVYRGRYEVVFVLNCKGVLSFRQAKEVKKNQLVNGLTIVLGLLSGKPATVGAGMLALSRQKTFLKWKDVTKVIYKPESHTILLWGGWSEQVAVFCTGENYSQVKNKIMIYIMYLKKEAL